MPPASSRFFFLLFFLFSWARKESVADSTTATVGRCPVMSLTRFLPVAAAALWHATFRCAPRSPKMHRETRNPFFPLSCFSLLLWSLVFSPLFFFREKRAAIRCARNHGVFFFSSRAGLSRGSGKIGAKKERARERHKQITRQGFIGSFPFSCPFSREGPGGCGRSYQRTQGERANRPPRQKQGGQALPAQSALAKNTHRQSFFPPHLFPFSLPFVFPFFFPPRARAPTLSLALFFLFSFVICLGSVAPHRAFCARCANRVHVVLSHCT